MIDVHTHMHPPRLFAAIRRWFAERSDWDISAQPSDPHAIARALAAAGVERFVFFSYAHKPGFARELNTWLAATARELGGAGVPLGTVHLDDPAYVEDLELALDDGCAGIKIHEDVQQLDVDDERFAPVYERIAARGGIVIAHIGPIPWRSIEKLGLARVERVLQRHPELQFVVAHMGLPDSEGFCALTERYPNLYLDTTMVFAPGSPLEAPLPAALVERYSKHILYGTDFPNIPYAYRLERRGLEALGLSPAALEAILRGNAARLIEPFLR